MKSLVKTTAIATDRIRHSPTTESDNGSGPQVTASRLGKGVGGVSDRDRDNLDFHSFRQSKTEQNFYLNFYKNKKTAA